MAVTALAAGCGASSARHPGEGRAVADRAAASAEEASLVRSNILRGDYAGSRACAGCHAEIYAKWEASPMRRMTRLAPEARIEAPFDGRVFRFKGDSVTLEERSGRKYMRLETQRSGATIYRVSKVIGGRYREDFAGYEVSSEGDDGVPLQSPERETVLPVSYLIFGKSLRYKGYSVMVKERPHLEKGGAVWRQACIFCHNTAPEIASLYDDLLGGGASYQGSVSDRLLPEERLWRARIRDRDGLSRALAAEIGKLRDAPVEPAGRGVEKLLAEAVKATRARFGEAELVEVGIGCEACHNGSREHAEAPTRLPSFAIRSPLVSLEAPDAATRKSGPPGRAEWVNHTCARCHTVLFSRYPFTWEGGHRDSAPGGSSINSGEARDFLLGGCSKAMSCAACHDPHTEDRREDLDALAGPRGDALCLRCHGKYEALEARRAHTHHAPGGEGSACLSCHMPRKNAGLAYRLTRYHRIGSPTDAARVEKDRPLECALCHVEKSVGALVGVMERWWGKRYDRGALRALYGPDLGVSALLTTIASGKPHEQMTAAGALAERGPRRSAEALVPLLGHDYPLVRSFGRAAIERLLGRPLPVDLDGEPATITAEARALVQETARADAPGR